MAKYIIRHTHNNNNCTKFFKIISTVLCILILFYSFFSFPQILQSIAIPVHAEENDISASTEKSRIKSVIPYVDKIDNGIEKSVPVQSKEDLKNYPASVYLMIKTFLSNEDTEIYKDKKIYIFKLRPYQKPEEINTLEPVKNFTVSAATNSEFTVTLPFNFSESNEGEIFNKFVMGVESPSGYKPISDARYIDDINNLSNVNETPKESKTKKGLEVQMLGDSLILGIEHTIINIYLNDIFTLTKGENTGTFNYNGETFYCRNDKLAEYGEKIKFFSAQNISVTAVLLLRPPEQQIQENNGENGESQTNEIKTIEDILIHPNSEINSSTLYCGINTSAAESSKYFEAIMTFIANNFVKENTIYGKISNIILGDEIGRSLTHNNMGVMSKEEYVENYMRAVRIADTAVRARFGGARVYIPFDNYFASKPLSDVDYVNKELIDLICESSVKEGNFPWNVAFHAYNEDRSKAAFWKEVSALNDYSTPIITMKNIETLCNYINIEKGAYLKDSKKRKILLSGQGFSSGDNSQENQKLQAAAYCYAYNKARAIPDIEAFIYRRHVDASELVETGNLGLWTRKDGTVNEPLEKKILYNVFKSMDTDRESEVTDFAKIIIDISDWNEVISEYQPTPPSSFITQAQNEKVTAKLTAISITRFNSADLAKVLGTANYKNMALIRYENPKSEYTNSTLLSVNIENSISGDYGGISKSFDTDELLDIRNQKYIRVRMRVDTEYTDVKKIPVLLIIEGVETAAASNGTTNGNTSSANSGTGLIKTTVNEIDVKNKPKQIYEGTAEIEPNKDIILYFNIEQWIQNKVVTNIRLLANPLSQTSYIDNGEEGKDGENGNSDSRTAVSGRSDNDFTLIIYDIVSARNAKVSVWRIILNVILIILGLAVLTYGALFARARYITYKRRQARILKKQQNLARQRDIQNRLLQNHRSMQNQNQQYNQQYSQNNQHNQNNVQNRNSQVHNNNNNNR